MILNRRLKCIVVDDEPLAREGIERYVQDVDFLELSSSATNPVELTRALDETAADLVFLDIQMPVINGIDFLKTARNMPMVIITTAYPSYALESFQLDVLDYLVKPITFSRFFKAVTKAKDYYGLKVSSNKTTETMAADYFFVKCDYKYERIYFHEILFVQAMQNYVTIQTSRGKFVTLLSLKSVEEKLDPTEFIRVHKSYIVAKSKIEAIENAELKIHSYQIPVSRNFHEELLSKVVNQKLWKKD
jgi:DNA-binding LytR/AlgR family response regulator